MEAYSTASSSAAAAGGLGAQQACGDGGGGGDDHGVGVQDAVPGGRPASRADASRRSSVTGAPVTISPPRARTDSATASGRVPTPPSMPMNTGPVCWLAAALAWMLADPLGQRGRASGRPGRAAGPPSASRCGTRRPRRPRRAAAPRGGRRPRGPGARRHVLPDRHVVADLRAGQVGVPLDAGEALLGQHPGQGGGGAGDAHHMALGHGAQGAAGPERGGRGGGRLEAVGRGPPRGRGRPPRGGGPASTRRRSRRGRPRSRRAAACRRPGRRPPARSRARRARTSRWAAASPAMPAPMTTTCPLPVSVALMCPPLRPHRHSRGGPVSFTSPDRDRIGTVSRPTFGAGSGVEGASVVTTLGGYAHMRTRHSVRRPVPALAGLLLAAALALTGCSGAPTPAATPGATRLSPRRTRRRPPRAGPPTATTARAAPRPPPPPKLAASHIIRTASLTVRVKDVPKALGEARTDHRERGRLRRQRVHLPGRGGQRADPRGAAGARREVRGGPRRPGGRGQAPGAHARRRRTSPTRSSTWRAASPRSARAWRGSAS